MWDLGIYLDTEIQIVPSLFIDSIVIGTFYAFLTPLGGGGNEGVADKKLSDCSRTLYHNTENDTSLLICMVSNRKGKLFLFLRFGGFEGVGDSNTVHLRGTSVSTMALKMKMFP